SRCPRRENPPALLVDRHLHAVDLGIVERDRVAELAVALGERREAAAQLLLHEAAHREHLAAHALELRIETGGGVVGQISGIHGLWLPARSSRARSTIAQASA